MTKHKRPTPAAMAKAVDAFNARHAIGDIILCWPAMREGKPVPRTIKAPGAVILSGHTPVVYVAAGGCIALTHVSSERPDQDAAAQLAVEGSAAEQEFAAPVFGFSDDDEFEEVTP